jgi:hypothetical protein
MARYPTRQSLQCTAAAAGVLALVLATAPVIPTLDADGNLTLSSGAAYAKGKGGSRGRGDKGHANRGGGQGGRYVVGRGRDQNGHADRGGDRSARIRNNGVFATDAFHGLPPGLGKRRGNLPPGLAKRGVGNLPPGLAKDHPIPPGLTNRTELPPGLSN